MQDQEERESTPLNGSPWDAFYGPNAGYALELYERYQDDPDSVDPTTRRFFQEWESVRPEQVSADANGSTSTVAPSPNGHAVYTRESVDRVVKAARLARSIREYGHLAARIDPLGKPGPGDPMINCSTHGISDADLEQLPATIVWPDSGPELRNCKEAIDRLRQIYSGSIGYEFDHVEDFTERTWLHDAVESGKFCVRPRPDEQRELLMRLTEVEGLERFLHTTFVGQKRFSIEGNDALVPMLDELLRGALDVGTREVLIGMAHRGRLNVLAHILKKPYSAIFSEFHSPTERPGEGSRARPSGWSGDVKYHLGAHATYGEAGDLEVTLADNPSHLEFINPVVEGFARAAQDNREHAGPPRQDPDRALPVTIHGDAAFTGEGVVTETLNLSGLVGYGTGGTIRIIVNNQVGFTTSTSAGRSTLYASDPAKGFEIPVVHVNADDPEACIGVMRLAHAYRSRFHKDFLIDLVGYRRWGHNEGDEPSFTQPLMYSQIRSHPTARALYAERLASEQTVSPQEAEEMVREVHDRLRHAREEVERGLEAPEHPPDDWVPLSSFQTAVPEADLRAIHRALLDLPQDFRLHPTLRRVLERRQKALDREGGIDWSLAETLALAAILAEATPIRMTGQDTERGTFSQRHLVLRDPEDEVVYVPLQSIPQASASFAIYNSPLSEAATLGFEYGYTVHAPDALVLWEAQFGDFSNAGQVLIDQFIASARTKWQQSPALVLLLPHGYEGQGPEHSSARLERYLQLAGEDNWRVANCTTPAQYFHLLRLQAATLASFRRPLVLLTPKSLLRHPAATSGVRDLSNGTFQPVLQDSTMKRDPEVVERLILCSGKIAVDLQTTAKHQPERLDWMTVARVELLYPFPQEELRQVIEQYPNLREVAWLQEEPRNMGAWSFIAPRLQGLLPAGVSLTYIGRPERASTAEGKAEAHAREQTRIVEAAFRGERAGRIETHGGYDVS